MVNSEKALTGAEENMRGFVGTRHLSNESCKNGRSRIRFDICAGDTDVSKLKFPIWRKCVGYDDIANRLKDLQPGEYLKVSGYILPEIKRDYAGKPVFLPWGEPVIENVIILQNAVRLRHDKQNNMFEGWPSGAADKVDTPV